MKVFFWVLQILLGLHTAMGAMWWLANGPDAVPSLSGIPVAVWLAMCVLELAFAVGLLLPALHRPAGWLTPIAALGVVAEMLVMSGFHLASGSTEHGQMVYWLVVVALCGLLAWGRWRVAPILGRVGG